MKRLNKDTEMKIVELYQKGEAIKTIEEKARVCNRTLYKALNRNKITPDRKEHHPQRWNGALDSKVKRLFLEGMTIPEICEVIGKKSTGSVHYRLVNHIIKDTSINIKYKSQLTGKWKMIKKKRCSLRTLRQCYNRCIKHAGHREDVKFQFANTCISNFQTIENATRVKG